MGRKKIKINPELLRTLYWTEGKTIREIATILHLGDVTTNRLFKRYNIPVRDKSGKAKTSIASDPFPIKVKLANEDNIQTKRLLAEYDIERMNNKGGDINEFKIKTMVNSSRSNRTIRK